jgi:hypothetical protein
MLRNFFLELYLFQKFVHGRNMLALIGSFIILTLLEMMNVISLIIALQLLIHAHLWAYLTVDGKKWFAIMLSLIPLANLGLLYPITSYLKVEEYGPRTRFLLWYFLITVGLFVAMWLMRK